MSIEANPSRRFRAAGMFVVAAIVVLIASTRAQPAPAASGAIDAFRERLRADVAADNVGSITAAVVAGDRTLWAEGFGWADRDRRVPAGVETIYRIGSISKTFTAIVLAQLVDRRTIALDDAVERYLPEVRGFASPRDGREADHVPAAREPHRRPDSRTEAAGRGERTDRANGKRRSSRRFRRPRSTRCRASATRTRTSATACSVWRCRAPRRRRS